MKRFLLLFAVLSAFAAAAPAAALAAPPSGVTAMALDGRVELAWQHEPGATGYRIYRGTSATTVTTPLMTNPLTPTDLTVPASYLDVGAVNGTTYFYAVRAIVSGVESANSRLVRAMPRAATCAAGNLVTRENCQAGDTEWNVGFGTGVRAFGTLQSIDKGGSVDLKVSAPGATTVDIEIFRSGYYGGAGARLYSTLPSVPVATQPGCVTTPSLGQLDCTNWSVTQKITTTASWPSGVYLIRVVRRDTGDDTHVLLVVRDDARHAELMFGVPTTTYQAYNNYGGKSLYDHNSTGAATVSGTPRAVKVSFDRPYEQQHDFAAHDWYTRTDYATVAWLERSGYDVSYNAVSDLERSGATVRDHRAFISAAHDEYYSTAMRDALEQARAAGTDLFFTGSNEVYWKVRFEPSGVDARQDRVLVVYKSTQSGGPDPSGIPTGTWRDPAGANKPENALTGVMYVGQKDYTYFPMKVTAAQGQDRIWRYTGLDTQAVGATATVGTGMLGWEWDARVDNGAEPQNVVTLAASPGTGDILQDAGRVYAPGSAMSHMTKYTAPSGALIVTTGTNHWPWGLALDARNDGEPDRRIQQATTNILMDMGAVPETPASNMVLDDPTAPPLITQRTPGSGATDIDPATLVRAVFSRPMDAATITPTSVRLEKPDGSAVSAAVAYDTNTFAVTLTSGFALNLNTTYTVRLASTVKAANGVALGTPQSWTFTTRPPDTTPPAVAVTSPADGSTVIASGTLTANATDAGGVAGVRFRVDGVDVGAEDTAAPYTMPWNVQGLTAGNHSVTAIARDTSDNSATSAPVTVTVDPKGLVAAYGFEETTGTTVTDASGKSNAGTVSGATRTTSGRFGRALTFDGVNDIVNVPDSPTLDLTSAVTMEAWVNPSVAGGWRTALMKEQTAGLVYGMYANTDTNRPSAHVYTSNEFDTRGTAAAAVNTWTHLAATYDGTTLRMYANGTQVSTKAVTGNVIASTGALRIGGNAIWGEYFQGSIDEVRLYRRVLSATEIQSDMNASIVSPDTQPPTAPTNLVATGSIGQVSLTWTASTDDGGVAHYNVHRSATPAFTPTVANRVAQVTTGTSYADPVAAGTWYYRVVAEDGASNPSPSSNEASATATSDTTAPTVAMTAPAGGSTLVGSVNVTANAADNVGVAGVQFRLGTTNLGTEDTTAPYSLAWDTRTVANNNYTLTAIARDAAGNTTTATSVPVTVNNPPVDTSGLVAAYGFEEPSGSGVTDTSSQANAGTLTGATRTAAGRYGGALSFSGAGDWVTTPDANSLDLSTAMTLEAWVNPSATGGWRTAVLKEGTGGLTYGMYANSATNRPSTHVHIGASELDTRGTAQLPLNTWSHLATTYDGANLLLYVNGTLVATRPTTGALAVGSGPLRIGGNSFAADEFFAGLIDEVRVYNRALTAGEIQVDMGSPIVSSDASPPTAPTGLTATGGIGQASLSWSAAADDIGVAKYNVHRSATSGFTPSTANRVAQPTGTGYVDTGLAPGTWFYKVTAQDAAGNIGPASTQASATATADTTPPTVSLTAPAAGATVVGTVHLTANAADNVAVASVQFKVDGTNVGAPDTSAPYDVTWDTLTATNTTHTITAVASDGSNQTTSAGRTVTVNNPPVDTTGLVAAYGFEEGTGAAVDDASPSNNDGTITGASWNPTGKYGTALIFDGVDDRINVADNNTLDLSDGMTLEAWVHPDQHAGWRNVMMKEAGGDLAYSLYSSGWNDRPSGHINTGAEHDTRAPAGLPVGTWSHLAMTYDATTLRLYVDGTQVASTAYTGNLIASTGALRIGGNAIWGENFKGMIDEVRIYRRALTATEIQHDRDTAVKPGSQPGGGPETVGQFAPPVSWPLVPVHIATLNNVKIAVWDGFDAALNSERIWDPATGQFDPIPSGRNLFCAAHITLPDGRLFIAGGHIEANVGLKDTHIYNPTNHSWFRGTDMARGRWYPTATTLPDGRILVVSGDNITLNAPGQPTPLKNASETLPEIYNVDTNTWTPLPAGQRRMPLYPFMFLLPDGRVADTGPDLQTRTLNTTTGQWTNVTTSQVDGHSAVMYRPGKILKSGTWADVDYPGIVASNRAQTIDFNQANPTWQDTASMHHGRSYHTLTALPDGTVLASGGGSESDGVDHSKAVFPVEIWNPDTGQWTEGASHQRARLYHSSALLLQDGRVLLAGGGAFGSAINESNAEIYSPPYLFKGPRPSISSAPTSINLGQNFTVNTPDAATVQKVALMRMGSVTHNFDMDQRFMNLNMTQSGAGTLSVDAPTNINIAPPGWYYLFAINGQGVPSTGAIIQIKKPSADTEAPGAPGNLAATVQNFTDVRLNWTAATDNVGIAEYRVHRSATTGFTPSAANRIATVSGSTLTYTDPGRPNGTWYYQVVAADAAGNTGASSLEENATIVPDTTPPTVSVTAPAASATVSGATVSLTANAADNRGVASVQFKVDGTNVGSPDTSSPYSATWDSRTVSDGPHSVTAVATDTATLSTTSASVAITVNNAPAPDTTAPTAPTGLTATGTTNQVQLAWTAASDNVAVVRYNVYRSTTAGFTPSAVNRIAQPATTSYTDPGLAGGDYFYRVTAEDAAGNIGPATAEVKGTVDATAPVVAITAPTGGTVSGTISVTANATDAIGVSGVQFRLDGAVLGAEDTASPYSVSWNTATATNTTHTLTAVARDAAGNATTSATVTVTVSNTAPPPIGLVTALGFDEASGTSALDTSGANNPGAISGATRSATGKFGGALSFDGVNDIVTVADANSLDLTNAMTLEAWVRPSVLGGWRTLLLKERPGGLVYALYGSEDANRPSVHSFIGASEFDTRGTAQVAANVWTHVAATYDGLNLRLYVNGVQVSSRALSGNMVVSTGALRIGGNNIWSEWFAGLIDEVRVYNRALTVTEVTADMNRPVNGP
jgi:hypothetical protein